MAVRIVQVSDTHFSERAPETSANWRAVVDYVTNDPPDLVVHSGDISLDGAGSITDLRFSRAALYELPVPWRVIAGNHDIGDFGGASQPVDDERRSRFEAVFGDRYWSTSLGSWQVVGIDIQSLIDESNDSESDWSWLGQVLTEGSRTVLFMHRPLMPIDADEVDDPDRYVNEPGRGRLRQLIRDSGVEVVASGHVHQSRRVEIDDRIHVWAPSTWASLPDRIQPVIGGKVVGVVEHILDDDGAESRFVVPPGIVQHVIGETLDSPYAHEPRT